MARLNFIPITMQILLNGLDHSLDQPHTLESLLRSLGLEGKPVVVELNREAIFPRDFPNISISDGDRIEIVTLAAGG
jgi:thiamine biosynthesis protein ThiS